MAVHRQPPIVHTWRSVVDAVTLTGNRAAVVLLGFAQEAGAAQ